MSMDKRAYTDYGREFEYKTVKSPFQKFQDKLYYFFLDGPVTWFREKVVEPNRKEYYWYHRQYPRVPTMDECYLDDPVCKFEANEQIRRDHKVDSDIITILKKRYENCVLFEGEDDRQKCEPLRQVWDDAITSWFIKYGEQGAFLSGITCLMKQKHRMVWERRYGPVGSGMTRKKSADEIEKEMKECD